MFLSLVMNTISSGENQITFFWIFRKWHFGINRSVYSWGKTGSFTGFIIFFFFYDDIIVYFIIINYLLRLSQHSISTDASRTIDNK